MDLVRFDKKNDQYTVRLAKRDFLDLWDVFSGILSTASDQDFTALGASRERVRELKEKLECIIRDGSNRTEVEQ